MRPSGRPLRLALRGRSPLARGLRRGSRASSRSRRRSSPGVSSSARRDSRSSARSSSDSSGASSMTLVRVRSSAPALVTGWRTACAVARVIATAHCLLLNAASLRFSACCLSQRGSSSSRSMYLPKTANSWRQRAVKASNAALPIKPSRFASGLRSGFPFRPRRDGAVEGFGWIAACPWRTAFRSFAPSQSSPGSPYGVYAHRRGRFGRRSRLEAA